MKIFENKWLPKVICIVLFVILAVTAYTYRSKSQEKSQEIKAYNTKMTKARFDEKKRLDGIYDEIITSINNNLKGIIYYNNDSSDDIEIVNSLRSNIQNNILNKIDFSKIVKKEVASLLTLNDYNVSIPIVSSQTVSQNDPNYLVVLFVEKEISQEDLEQLVDKNVEKNQKYIIVDLTEYNKEMITKKFKKRYLNVAGKSNVEVGNEIYNKMKKLGYLDEILEVVDNL